MILPGQQKSRLRG